jgi:hypothetical protein
MVALNSLLNPRHAAAGQGAAPSSRGVVNPLHFAAKAKRVIYLYQAGGPSQLETFDYKPKLAEMNGTPMPESLTRGQQIAQLQGQRLTCFGPTHGFKRFGQSGQLVCELFPHMGGIVDDTCIVRSMWTEQINHDPAHTFMNSGSILTGRPSVGSWVLYGLGAETENLPDSSYWSRRERAARCSRLRRVSGRPGCCPATPGRTLQLRRRCGLLYSSPGGVSPAMQKDSIDAINALNQLHDRAVHDRKSRPGSRSTRWRSRCRRACPSCWTCARNRAHVWEMYGAKPGDGSYAANCLLARRLAERGVRFIQLYHRDWDHHNDVRNNIVFKAQEVDKPTAALITDLKQRGMLDDTLVIWGGEFGRRRCHSAAAATITSRGFRSCSPAAASRRASPTGDRRPRVCGGREPGQRARLSRDDALPARDRCREIGRQVSGDSMCD